MARTRYGLPGVYNASDITLTDGEGAALALDVNGAVKMGAVDIQIGAVEIKNASSDVRANVSPANTARVATDNVLLVQTIAADGSIGGSSAVTSVIPGTGATNLGKAEDAVAASGDTGVAILSVRRDTAATSAGTDGDYATVNTDSTGHQWVREGFAPDYEDNTNNVAAVMHLPLANSTYAWTRFVDLGANATANVKASAGNVYSAYIENTNAAKRYLQFHNTATTPAGGAVPLYTFAVAGSGSILIGSDFWGLAGANFSMGPYCRLSG